MKKILIEELIKPTSTSNVNVGKITSIEKSIFDDIDSSASASKVKVNLKRFPVYRGFKVPVMNDHKFINLLSFCIRCLENCFLQRNSSLLKFA